MAWKAEDRHTFMGRIPQRDGPAVVRTLGTGDERIVPEIHDLLKRLKRWGSFDTLQLIADRHVTAFQVYTAEKNGVLGNFVKDELAKLAAAPAARRECSDAVPRLGA